MTGRQLNPGDLVRMIDFGSGGTITWTSLEGGQRAILFKPNDLGLVITQTLCKMAWPWVLIVGPDARVVWVALVHLKRVEDEETRVRGTDV